MIQSSWIKLIKENIIEVKEKYEQGLKKGIICESIVLLVPESLFPFPKFYYSCQWISHLSLSLYFSQLQLRMIPIIT